MKKAFSLVELLVVMAVIAVLSAFLFPVFAVAKVKRDDHSFLNLRRMSEGRALYFANLPEAEAAQGENEEFLLRDRFLAETMAHPGKARLVILPGRNFDCPVGDLMTEASIHFINSNQIYATASGQVWASCSPTYFRAELVIDNQLKWDIGHKAQTVPIGWPGYVFNITTPTYNQATGSHSVTWAGWTEPSNGPSLWSTAGTYTVP